MDVSMADIPNPLLRVMDKDPRPFTGRGQARSQDFERVGGWVSGGILFGKKWTSVVILNDFPNEGVVHADKPKKYTLPPRIPISSYIYEIGMC